MNAKLSRAGARSAYIALLLLSVLLVIYFLGITAPGRSLVARLANKEITGDARVGNLQADPAAGTVALVDLSLRDSQDRPVVEIGALQVEPNTLDGKQFAAILVDEARLHLAVDANGRLNLDGFLREKEKKPPRQPTPFRIERLGVDDSTLFFSSPWGEAQVGPLALSGTIADEPGIAPAGTVEAHVADFHLAPLAEAADVLTGLVGTPGPYRFGPLEGLATWGDGRVQLDGIQLVFPLALARLDADLDLATRMGTATLSVLHDGAQVGSLALVRNAASWSVAGRVSRLELPGHRGQSLDVPAVELNGLLVNAVESSLTFRLNRFSLSHIPLGTHRLVAPSLSATVQIEAARPFAEHLAALDAGADPWAAVNALLADWQKGEVRITFLAESLDKADAGIFKPLRLNLAVVPRPDGKVQVDAELGLHPHGRILAEVVVDRRRREGTTPYVATITVEDLETTPLLELAGAPGMLRSMFAGTFAGTLQVAAANLGDPVVQVKTCRFDLRGPQNHMTFTAPEGAREWDFSAPSFNFFTKQVAFGNGRLVMSVRPAGEADAP